MQQPLHEAYTDNEKRTLSFLKEYKIANKEIEAELFEVYRKMNVENPLISDFYRFGHLQKLQDKIQKTIQQLGNLEEDYLKGRMKQGLVLGIETVINKIPETELNKRAVDQMIMRPWQGGNFSDRVWKNKRLLANQLNDKLRNGIIQGKSPFQIANDLSERMQVGRYQAQRLVRTEYMHVLNQGQIEGYKAKGYTKLKWHASKDERTCEICGKHHGNEYDIDEAPHLPAHPGCRCTFVPVIDVESATEELKQARDAFDKANARNNLINNPFLYVKRNGIIEEKVDVWTPCLVEIKTGKIVQTEVKPINIKKKDIKGWKFDFYQDQKDGNKVLALYIQGSKKIESLISYSDSAENMAMYVCHIERRPGKKEYEGITAHMFAAVVKESYEKGYDGVVFFDTKNQKLNEHYAKTLNALLISPYRMAILEEGAKLLYEKYYGKI